MSSLRPRRSALYLPGSNERAIQKAATLDCDAVILDLEDAVAPEDKSKARRQVCEAVSAKGFGKRELVIRINGPATSWYEEDVLAAISAAPDAILLPKVETPDQVVTVANVLRSRATGGLHLWCMLETPQGILSAADIARSDPTLECLVMGTSDLTKDLHARHTRTRLPLLLSLELCLLAARAHGRSILDGVCLDLHDEGAFREACDQGRDLGFDGKTLIHPKQIAICNETFSPSKAEVDQAKAVREAFAAARSAGHGVAVLNGSLVEELHVREADRILALDSAIRSQHASPS